MYRKELLKDDKELWRNLLNGNIFALELLYRKYYALMFNYGMKCTSDDELVRDCIQEIFVKLSQSHNISETESPRAYLLKSLRNLIKDKNSSFYYQSASLSFNDEIYSELVSDEFTDRLFGKTDEDLRLRKALVKALLKLSAQQKHMLYLRYIKDLSHKEVAEIMDMNIQSSMNLLSRTLQRLREILS